MKNIFLLIIILFPIFASAQTTIAFETQYKEDYKGYAAMLSMNNEIIAMIQNRSCDAFFLTTNNGIIERKKKDCTWNYIPHKLMPSIIYLNEIVNSDTLIICKMKIYIKPWRFVPTLGKHFPRKCEILHLTKEELKMTYLTMESINTNLSAKLPVANFEIYIIRYNELLYSKRYKKNSRKIQAACEEQFERLRKGDIIEFINIKYEYPSKNDVPLILDTYDIKILIE